VCLPDPRRNISRRHLSVWNEADVLRFEVLSAHNRVAVDGVEYPPGARGTVPPAGAERLAAYRSASRRPPHPPRQTGPPTAPPTPGREFEKEAAQLVASVSATQPVEEDPFGEWGFQSTFARRPPAACREKAWNRRRHGAFFAGLGLPGARSETSPGRARGDGAAHAHRAAGLLQALQAAGVSRQPAGPDDRTALERARVNPLRMDTPLESKLWYLFGGQAAAAGCMPPGPRGERAGRPAAGAREGHGRGVRQAVERRAGDFAPEALKARLLPGGAKLFESAKAWEAFARDYAEQDATAGPGSASCWTAISLGLCPGRAACETPHRRPPSWMT
jgi:predicted component of type VI protein secretion system